jgi:hypothetical protein
MRAPRTRSASPARKIERKIERKTVRSRRLTDPFEQHVAERRVIKRAVRY